MKRKWIWILFFPAFFLASLHPVFADRECRRFNIDCEPDGSGLSYEWDGQIRILHDLCRNNTAYDYQCNNGKAGFCREACAQGCEGDACAAEDRCGNGIADAGEDCRTCAQDVLCPENHECNPQGLCEVPPFCEDDDPQNDSARRGTVRNAKGGYGGPVLEPQQDRCDADGRNLIQVGCGRGRITAGYITDTPPRVCPFGTGCALGLCRSGWCQDERRPVSFGQCSPTRPHYCNQGVLQDRCDLCGCPGGDACRNDGTCAVPECETFVSQGDPDEKLDIVFVGDDYYRNGHEDQFIQDTAAHKDRLLSYEPFRSQSSKINWHRVRVDDRVNDLRCEINCGGVPRVICCRDATVSRVVRSCPYDEIMVLVDTEEFGGSGGDYAVSAGFAPVIMSHEFGHSFGGLDDEYSYGGNAPEGDLPGPNCSAENRCQKWQELRGEEGVGCFQQCKWDNWFRPLEENSLMFDLGGDYNPVGERHLRQLLERYR